VKEIILMPLKHLAKAIGPKGFGGNGYPKVIMTDDDSAERNALKSVFTQSELLLCLFHVTQAMWRWLWTSKNLILKDDRKELMTFFQAIVYAESINTCEIKFTELTQDKNVKKYPNFVDHVTNMWNRSHEWALSYRKDLITRGHNTNNFVEASMRILKDIVLQRCKVFNACALIDFIGSVSESYHKRRLLEYANNRNSKNELSYLQLMKKSKDIVLTRLSDHLFEAQSASDDKVMYSIDTKLEVCDCLAGAGGKFCKHLGAVHSQFHINLANLPRLTPSDRYLLATLALGEDLDPSFYESMEKEDDLLILKNITSELGKDLLQEAEISNVQENTTSMMQDQINELNCNILRISEIVSNDKSESMMRSLYKLNTKLLAIQTPSQFQQFC